jgi:pimeloyl-ACP methyl ester carboxylesterase
VRVNAQRWICDAGNDRWPRAADEFEEDVMNIQLQKPASTPTPPFWPLDLAREAWAYGLDAFQRSILFLDVLRQRGDRYEEHAAKEVPHVLKFDCELVMDGRKLQRPVNYALARMIPPKGVEIDNRKRPFVVVDPRAGHGPGIGGFKAQSEIGVALNAGHPCYFIGFLPEPEPGQTIADIAYAEAAFLERVTALHPQAEGKPAVIGNCQAGWAVMMVAALRPELFGPIIVAGSPLSYWAGTRGQHPMRYTGGLLGGSWLTALMGDLGNGKFDGAWLVSNFENLNPANTYWTKHYNLYSKVDTEASRYLEFEEWWGGHVLLNAEEIQEIVDQLFVGNKLATAEITTKDGASLDFRNIKAPIVVFCSKADNITPPPQALDWILDLYRDVEDIRAHGQTIIYAVHESAGHLGIFVAGSVAKKEHAEFASNIDMIEVLPPGLYEAVMTPKQAGDKTADLVGGDYLVRFEARTLDDIRALGTNSEEDDRRFATVARVSDINLGLYRTLVQPWIRLFANEGAATWMRKMHPLRLQFELFSRANPFMSYLESGANVVRQNRQAVSNDNICAQAEASISKWIESSLQIYGDMRDALIEAAFLNIYGSPALQAMVGLKASDGTPRRRPGLDATYQAFVAQRTEELKRNIGEGGPREAAIRAALYIRLPEGIADERGFRLLQRLREEAGSGLTLAAFEKVVRDQFFSLLLDERRAVEAIPGMLAKDAELASRMIGALARLIEVVGVQTPAGKARLREMEKVFKQRPIPANDAARGAMPQEAPARRASLRKVSGEPD